MTEDSEIKGREGSQSRKTETERRKGELKLENRGD